jgi:hypothetical protein
MSAEEPKLVNREKAHESQVSFEEHNIRKEQQMHPTTVNKGNMSTYPPYVRINVAVFSSNRCWPIVAG